MRKVQNQGGMSYVIVLDCAVERCLSMHLYRVYNISMQRGVECAIVNILYLAGLSLVIQQFYVPVVNGLFVSPAYYYTRSLWLLGRQRSRSPFSIC